MAKTELGKEVQEFINSVEKLVTDLQKDTKRLLDAAKKLRGNLGVEREDGKG